MFCKTVSALLREPSLGNRKHSGSPVRHKGLSLFLFFCLSVVAAADTTKTKPVDTTQLTAWLTAGISSTRLVQLIHQRGIAVVPTENEIHQLQAFGADEKLVRTLARAR